LLSSHGILTAGSSASGGARHLREWLAEFVVRVVDPLDDLSSTAFFVNEQGFLLTCWHVVEPDFAGTVHDWVWVEYRGARYRADLRRRLSNRNKDLAVLQVRGAELQRLRRAGFQAAPLAFPYQPADPVAALGYQRQDVVADAILLRGYVDPDNTSIPVPLEDDHGVRFATQPCLAVVFRHAHFDLGISGAPLLDVRTGRVVGVAAGVFPSSHSPTQQPLGFAVPLDGVPLSWPAFERDCQVLSYDPVLDDEIVPQGTEFLRHGSLVDRPGWAAMVSSFLEDPQRRSGYLLLVGGEGEGKSAFVAHRLLNRVEPVFYFLRRKQGRWEDPEWMLRSLTAQLLRKYPVGGNPLLRARLREDEPHEARLHAAAALFRDAIERVSAIVTSEGCQEVLWIDGLDEAFGPTAPYHDRPGLARLLPTPLPPGIYFVLTSRPGKHLDWLTADPRLCAGHRVEDEQYDNVGDVGCYLRAHANDVQPPLSPEFIARLAARTQGNFYIAVHKLAEIQRDPSAARDPEAIPISVKAYHAEVYQGVVDRAWGSGITEGRVRLVLGLLAGARELGELAPADLDACFADAPDQAEQILGWAADYFQPRPRQREPALPYEFNNLSVREFLETQLKAADLRSIGDRLAEGCWRQFRAGADRMTTYARRHLAAHLAEAGRWEDLLAALHQPELAYLRRWVDRGEDGEALEWLTRLVHYLDQQWVHRTDAAGLSTQIARLYSRRGRYDQAERWLRHALALTSARRGRRARSVALHELGSLRLYRGQHGSAARMYRQALRLCGGDDPMPDEAAANLVALASVSFEGFHFAETVRLASDALAAAERAGDSQHMVASQRLIGEACKHLGEYSQAAQRLETALRWCRQREVYVEEPRVLAVTGWLRYDEAALNMVSPAMATALFQHTLEAAERIRDFYFIVLAKLGLGWCALADNRTDEAAALFEEVQAARAGPESAGVVTGVAAGLAGIHHQRGEMDLAAASYQQIAQSLSDSRSRLWGTTALVGLGAARWHLGDKEAAETAWNKARQRARRVSGHFLRFTEVSIDLCRAARNVAPR
jgi:tetratricopeptide (TPR) repeat protein